MADGPALALQQAVVEALLASPECSDLVGARVYDEPPQPVVRPYMRLGRIEVRADRTTCARDWLIDYTIECHSRPLQGRVEAQRMATAVIAALDQAALAVTGYTLCWNDLSATSGERDADGLSYVSTVVFEAALDE